MTMEIELMKPEGRTANRQTVYFGTKPDGEVVMCLALGYVHIGRIGPGSDMIYVYGQVDDRGYGCLNRDEITPLPVGTKIILTQP